MRRVGRLAAIAPANSSEASAVIYPSVAPHFPMVFLHDVDSDGISEEGPDGRVSDVEVRDLSGRIFSILDVDGDGRFDRYFYSAGGETDSTFEDTDMDGRFEHSLGPEWELLVRIGSEWHRVTEMNGKRYVEMNGELVEVSLADGEWKTVE